MDELEERLAAVERALTDGDHDCSALAEGAANADRVARLETDVEELTDRVTELEAATQALRGYVGNIRSVNTDVEERANAALSKAEAAHRIATETETETETGTGIGIGTGIENGTGASGSDREHSDRTATGTDRTPGVERCDRCDRPLDDGDRDGPSVAPETGTSRLDALSDGDADLNGRHTPTDPTGAETDGGVPGAYLDDGGESGVLARIRDLL